MHSTNFLSCMSHNCSKLRVMGSREELLIYNMRNLLLLLVKNLLRKLMVHYEMITLKRSKYYELLNYIYTYKYSCIDK